MNGFRVYVDLGEGVIGTEHIGLFLYDDWKHAFK